ncbi:MAG: hypothetical protein IPI06_00280 [Gammaproteobacteria bacterium]|nr:hypothetical protein [Gammaproteobacteria bacterium]
MRNWLLRIGLALGVLVLAAVAFAAYQERYRSLPQDAPATVETPDFVFAAPASPVHWVTGCERFASRCIGAAPHNDQDDWWLNQREWLELVPLDGVTAGTPSALVERARIAAAAFFRVPASEIQVSDSGAVESLGTYGVTLRGPASSRYSPAYVVQLPPGKILLFVCHIESVSGVEGQQESCHAALSALRFPKGEALVRAREEAEQQHVQLAAQAMTQAPSPAAAPSAAAPRALGAHLPPAPDAPRTIRYAESDSQKQSRYAGTGDPQIDAFVNSLGDESRRLDVLIQL